MRPEHIIFVFLDGVGLGPADKGANPLSTLRLPVLEALAGEQQWIDQASPFATDSHVFTRLDARLGMPGLPQSGTGQATLFTGINCVQLAGRHWGPFPHSSSKAIIDTQNLFIRLARIGRTGQFLNAFPARFFAAVHPRDRWTVTTRCCVAADLPLRTEEDLREGRALAADLTGQAWLTRLGIDVPTILPAESGDRTRRLAQAADVTLFEYYLTDKAGHARDPEAAYAVLRDLNAYFAGLLGSFDPDRDLLLVTSDHGNLEDLSARGHTLNPVPLIALGRGADAFANCLDLTHVTPAIVRILAA